MTIVSFSIPRISSIAALALTLAACDGTEFEPTPPIAQILVGPGDCASLRVGSMCTLEATVLDTSGTVVADPPLVWMSMTNIFATVDFMGVVTGVNEGQETIVVRTPNGAVEAQTIVNVDAAEPVPPEPDGPDM